MPAQTSLVHLRQLQGDSSLQLSELSEQGLGTQNPVGKNINRVELSCRRGGREDMSDSDSPL